jgi:dipicolinate synthase subunit B
MIGYAFCGSYCTHKDSLAVLEGLCRKGYEIQPIFSENVTKTDTRFGTAAALRQRVEVLCGRKVIDTIVAAEPLGPKIPLEALVIAPCTGNTLAKMANGITDTAVCMAAKAHLRSNRPLLIALATNDALSSNLKNIGTMLQRKCVCFVPMRQDDCRGKPHSLVAEFSRLEAALQQMLQGETDNARQMQPLFLS